MSHITEGQAEITDLDALEDACKALGLELVRGQRNYRWYGHFVGDSKLPPGVKVEDLGKCEHAIRVAGSPDAYEVGLVPNADRPGWSFRWDYWSNGKGLMAHISKDGARGKDCLKLQHEYAAAKSIRRAHRLGYRHTLTRNPAGMVAKLSVYR